MKAGIRLVPVLLAACLALVGGGAPAAAMSLTDAKAQRLVAEGQDGLIHATQGSPSAAVRGLVSSTNAGRMDKYRAIAASRGVSVDQIQKVAAAELIKRTPGDQCVEAGAGRYVRKGSGSSCP